jgi:O-acetylhomoserine (thiol)-lyase
MSNYQQDTKCVQGGYTPGNGEPRQIPIVQSTTFRYTTSEAMGKLFDLESSGYFYSRLANPTNDFVAAKIAELEGGTAAMLTGSGQAANFFALFNICSCGDHIVASSSIYGGTFNLISVTMAKMGIEATFVGPGLLGGGAERRLPPEHQAGVRRDDRQPRAHRADIERFAQAAHAHGVPAHRRQHLRHAHQLPPDRVGRGHRDPLHDQVHGRPRPPRWAARSWTAGTSTGWRTPTSSPASARPDESYHGITYAEKFGMGGAFITKCTAQLMRDFGSMQSPQSAFLLNLGLESLHVRMARHCENGQAVAEFLSRHPKVSYVHYCGLPGDPYHALAEKYLPHGSCGVVSFELTGGRPAAEQLMGALKLAAIETHVADARTCCLNPASTTHRQMSEEQLAAAGVPAGLVRYSCGLEDKRDLIADLSQALDQIQ